MTRQAPIAYQERPEALQRPAALPFWGDRRPPKDYAEVFNVATAAETSTSSGNPVTRTVATLRLYGPIYDGWFGVSARNVGQALDELPDDVDEVRVRINSPGGDAWEGLAILNMLRAHDAKTVAIVDGVAASAASYLAAGCDETVMSPGTQMMIHDASAFAYGPADVMRKAATFLDSVSNSIASLYAQIAGGTTADWRSLMAETVWYTAEEAVESGLADRIGIVKDSGVTETAAVEDDELEDDDSAVENQWDLSMYPHAGRSQAPAPKPPSASAVGSTTPQETESAVAFSDEQMKTMRAQLGLPEDADEATIVAAQTEALTERAEPKTSAPELPEGHVAIPAAKLADLEAAAKLATTTAKNLHDKERDAFLDSVRSKYLPTSRAGWAAEYDRDEAGVRAHFATAPVLIPTDLAGHADQPETDDQLDIPDDELAAFAAQMGLSKEDLRG